MRALLLFLLFSLVPPFAQARIGETSMQFANRYGTPKDTPSSKKMDKTFALVEGAIHHTYEYEGWKIRAAFLRPDGPAVRMDISKLPINPSLQIRESELVAIKIVNTPLGMIWKQIPETNSDSPNGNSTKVSEASFAAMPGEKMWQRTDGAILYLRNQSIVRLELPTARQYEERIKTKKDQKARAAQISSLGSR